MQQLQKNSSSLVIELYSLHESSLSANIKDTIQLEAVLSPEYSPAVEQKKAQCQFK